jgi:gp010
VPRKRKQQPAASLEARENQLIDLAVNLAEKQLQEGTASSQVITHYLKLGTTRERLEQQKLAKENDLLSSKKEAIDSAQRVEELYGEALRAMRSYSGDDDDAKLQ